MMRRGYGRAFGDSSRRLFEHLRAAAADVNLRALGCEGLADLEAEAAASARHQNRLSGQRVVTKDIHAHRAAPPAIWAISAMRRRQTRKHIYKLAESCQGSSKRNGSERLQAEAKAVGARAIASVGAYAPLMRLDRGRRREGARIFRSWRPGRGTARRRGMGRRSLDPRGRSSAARRRARPDAVVFASTSAPFFERLQATLVVDALALPAQTRARDVSGSRRCAVSALLDALLGSGARLCRGRREAAGPRGLAAASGAGRRRRRGAGRRGGRGAPSRMGEPLA